MTALLIRILARLTGAYDKEPTSFIGRLFQLFAVMLWGIEDTLHIIAAWRDVDNAKGTTLDKIGRGFGVLRDGASDRFYRLMIKTKITALLSGGDVDTVILATSVLFGVAPEQVEVQELFPAKCLVILNENDLEQEYIDNAAQTAAIIKRVIAAGVGKEVAFRDSRKTSCTVYAGAACMLYLTITVPSADTITQEV